ncbi:MAG: hypothetical protein M1331_00775 [Candidatus Marsarchaeota archaeon]|nr:hypothetical protein [Candidatus Marsarchaeota archaeon]MCL5105918.1 hypothetical protein [Candidatus Marsarchaeota archaeon]
MDKSKTKAGSSLGNALRARDEKPVIIQKDFQKKLPSDTVLAVFHYLGEGSIFSSDLNRINAAFYNISQRKEFKVLFKEFSFDTACGIPYTETISTAITKMIRSDRLEGSFLQNIYRMPKCNLPYQEQYLDSIFSDEEKKLLKKVAELFRELISKDGSGINNKLKQANAKNK